MGWYEDVFKKDQADKSQDFGNFNYSTEQDKVKRRRDVAHLLLQQSGKGQQGQFIKSGDFTGYAGGNTVLSAALQGLTAYLGMKGQEGADADQKALDKTSLDALQFNMDNKPWEKRLAQAEAKVDSVPALDAGGMSPPVSDVQSMPVREQAPSTARPLNTSVDGSPVRPNLGAMVAGNASVPTTDGPSAYVGNGDFKPLNMPKSALTPDMLKAASAKLGQGLSANDIGAVSMLGGAPAPATAPAAQPTRTPLPGTMPTAEPTPMPSPMLAAQGAAQPTAQPTAQAQAAAAQAPQGPTMAEQMAYLQRVANTGPMGQQAAQMLQQQMMAKPQLQHVTVKNDDGSESVLAFDPSGRTKPQVVYQPQRGTGPTGKQLERDKFASESFKNLSTAQEELNTTQQLYGKVQNARDLLTKYAPAGGVFSNIYSGIAKALGNDQANALDMALKDLAFSDLKSSFGGNPTEGERKAQLDVKASIERGLAPSQASLDMLSAGIERRMRTGQEQVDYFRTLTDQYRSQPEPRSSGSGMADSLFPRR